MTKSFFIALVAFLSTSASSVADSYTRFYLFVRNASSHTINYITATEPGMGYNNGWLNVPGSYITSDPTAVCKSEGRIDVFGLGSSGGLRHWYWQTSDNAWTTDSTDYGGSLVGSPDVCSWSSDRMDVFGLSSTNAIRHIYWRTSYGWSGWDDSIGAPPVTGGAASDPAAVSYQSSRIDLFVRGGDGHCWHKWYDSGTWYNWEDLGGDLVGGPDAATAGAGTLRVAARFASDNKIYRNNWSGTSWSGWAALDGTETFSSDPTIVCHGTGRSEVFARKSDGTYMKKSYAGGTWSAWIPVSNTTSFAGAPDAATYSGDRAFVYGTFWGEGSKTFSAISGVDIGQNVDQYGNAIPGSGYEIVVNQNTTYPCRPVLNAGAMNAGDTYPCVDPQNHHLATHTEAKDFVIGPLYIPSGQTWTLYYEGYPKDASGTSEVNWTEAVLQGNQVPSSGFTGMHLTLGTAANAAWISGRCVHSDGTPHAGKHVRLWGGPTGADTGFDASHDTDANGYFNVKPIKGFYDELSSGIRHYVCTYNVYVWDTSNTLHSLGTYTVTPGQHLDIGTFTVP